MAVGACDTGHRGPCRQVGPPAGQASLSLRLQPYLSLQPAVCLFLEFLCCLFGREIRQPKSNSAEGFGNSGTFFHDSARCQEVWQHGLPTRSWGPAGSTDKAAGARRSHLQDCV